MPETQGRVTLWGIDIFLAVAEEGSITAAAKRLGISPPAVSQQLASLEATLGATLFDRGSRPFALTSAGQIFRRHAQLIHNVEAEARADLSEENHARLVTLKLGVIEDFEAEVTPRLLVDLSISMPETRFLLETGPSHRLLDQLDHKALDLVIAAKTAFGEGEITGRSSFPLLQDPFVSVRPRSGGEVPLILYSQRHLMGRQIATYLEQQGSRYPIRFELDSYNAVLALVARGQGWTILTPLALHHAIRFQNDLSVEPLGAGTMHRTIALISRTGAMGKLPNEVARSFQAAVNAAVLTPALSRWPWLADDLKLL
ncbi:LysR family transcriptional regulator [Thioclava sp. FR2]|uniref:LysR family transcriptional regulator n=1 Tax=Thioclava sp. FR2 TaxID=3445780 RepID=UPI003EBA546F